MKKLLIIVSDLTDLAVYAGAAAARYSKDGNEVSAVLVNEPVFETAEKISSILGLKECICPQRENKSAEYAEQVDALASVYRRIRPDLILTYGKSDDPMYPSRSAIRSLAMTAYQTASGAGYRDGREVSPRQTPFFGLVIGNEKPDLYLSTDSGIIAQCEALRLLGLDETPIRAKSQYNGSLCSSFRDVPCTFADTFTMFGAIAKTGLFIY